MPIFASYVTVLEMLQRNCMYDTRMRLHVLTKATPAWHNTPVDFSEE
jgi:hypothetical protein